jgi:hypothetical protein
MDREQLIDLIAGVLEESEEDGLSTEELAETIADALDDEGVLDLE